MAVKKITISIANGELKVSNPSVLAHEGVDKLEWVADPSVNNFVVSFCRTNKSTRKPRSPLDGDVAHVAKGADAMDVSDKAGGSPPWKYSYAVAATDAAGALYALDPEIRIRAN